MPGPLSHDRLCEVVSYNPKTGVFRWKWRDDAWKGWNEKHVGKMAGTRCKSLGYIIISIDNEKYLGHRLAWFYVHGRWPKNQIDHIDCNRARNAIRNLREATPQQQRMNQSVGKANKSGFVGVLRDRRNGHWQARIKFNRKCMSIGFFRSKAAALKARNKAAAEHFGEFARLQ